ncbi:MAG: hypothetical protein KC413_23225, partial [Anaerolineales bacterium]|nr:hypothetical protein [Anaerolineales bacterium]
GFKRVEEYVGEADAFPGCIGAIPTFLQNSMVLMVKLLYWGQLVSRLRQVIMDIADIDETYFFPALGSG